MSAQSGANILALELEKVRDKVPLLYERDDLFLKLIQTRGDVEKVSSRLMRLPLQLVPGGKAGAFGPDGSDLGRGSGTLYDVAQVTPQFFKIGIEFTKLVEQVDILFANEGEAQALTGAASFTEAARTLSKACPIVCVTHGAKGSVIFADGRSHEIAAAPIERLVDTTGAGDLYASGFLYGLTHGRPLEVCGRLGSLAAAEIISHIGARPERRLKDLAAAAGLI